MKSNSLYLLAALLLITGCSKKPNSQDKLVRIPGTRVSLKPPAGFVLSSQFTGYQQESTNSSIMVTEMPAPFSELVAGFSDPTELQKKAMTLVSRKELRIDDHYGVLLHLRQIAYGQALLKWCLILGEETETVLVTAAFPESHASELSETLKRSVLSSKWRPNESIALKEALPFTIEPQGQLQFAHRMGNSVIYTKGGVMPKASIEEPLFVVAPSVSKIAIEDTEAFAKGRLMQMDWLKNPIIEHMEEIEIDNLQGFEIVAYGQQVPSDIPILVYQAILFEQQSYYLIVGSVGNQSPQEHLEVFRKMTRTFRRRR